MTGVERLKSTIFRHTDGIGHRTAPQGLEAPEDEISMLDYHLRRELSI